MFGPGEEFLGAQSTTIFSFFFINGSSKESKPSEAHPRIFFLVSSSSSDDARQSYWIVLLWTISSSSHRAKVLAALFAWNDVDELEAQEKKFDCDNYSWRKTRKTKRTCWQVWIFITLTRWLSTMMRKDFRLNCSDFIFSTTCLESGNAEFVFPKKFIRRFRKLFSTTLYLFFRGWWQIFVLLDARSQLLEVIFLLVQTEAQYNSDTINNIITVGVVKWGSSIFVLRCEEPWRASVTSESWSSSVVSSINFLNKSEFVRCWSCGRLRKRKIRN